MRSQRAQGLFLLTGHLTRFLSVQVLLQLKGQYKMGVVTGRPRSDCDFALQHFGLADVFEVRDHAPTPPPQRGGGRAGAERRA